MKRKEHSNYIKNKISKTITIVAFLYNRKFKKLSYYIKKVNLNINF